MRRLHEFSSLTFAIKVPVEVVVIALLNVNRLGVYADYVY